MRVAAFDLLTGDQIAPLRVADGFSWRASLTQPGDGKFTVLVRDALAPLHPAVMERLLHDWATVIVVLDGDHVQFAGVIVDDDWESWAGLLHLTCIEVGQIMAKRLYAGIDAYSAEGIVLSGQSIRDIQREVVRVSLTGGGPRWELPIDLPPHREGPILFEWFGYNFKSAQAAMDELGGMLGAGHFYLRPYLSGGKLRWRGEIGAPMLDAGTVRVPGATAAHPIVGRATRVRVRGDGVGRFTGLLAVGAGSEMDKRFGRAGAGEVEVATHGPWMDSTVTVSQIDNQAQLDAVAAGELEASGFKRTQIDFGVMLGDWLTAEMVQPGGTVVLDWPGDERLPSGSYGQYVLAVAGSDTQELKIETQEV